MKKTKLDYTSNKTKDGMTEAQLLKEQSKKKKIKPITDMYGNKIFNSKTSAFDKKSK